MSKSVLVMETPENCYVCPFGTAYCSDLEYEGLCELADCLDYDIIDFSDDDVDSKCSSDNPEDMFHSSMVYHAYIGMNNYCNRCGQKLDWREKE